MTDTLVMPTRRAFRAQALPQLSTGLFLTDGGIETTLIFHEEIELPHFAAFRLLASLTGRAMLRRYYECYIAIAKQAKTGFILESPTWRASPDWARRLGMSLETLDDLNRAAIELMHVLRATHGGPNLAMVISGCIGPRGDGYRPDAVMSPEEAEAYHARQIGVFHEAGADLVTAITMTNVAEAVGISRAACAAGLPVVISFTVETDGRLPTGEPLGVAIEAVDDATGCAPAYYMVNCAHPSHFGPVLSTGEPWVQRVRGLRANASRSSHAELDEATELDTGDANQLAAEYRELLAALPHLSVLGGCCGTDHRHIAAIAQACRTGGSHRRFSTD